MFLFVVNGVLNRINNRFGIVVFVTIETDIQRWLNEDKNISL